MGESDSQTLRTTEKLHQARMTRTFSGEAGAIAGYAKLVNDALSLRSFCVRCIGRAGVGRSDMRPIRPIGQIERNCDFQSTTETS